jgi:acyl-coenzyme A synthetase/AMP-(fatty) acid ligase
MSAAVLPLATLLSTGRPSDRPVALHEGRVRSWDELVVRVAGLTRVLEAPPATRWALFAEDAWAFAIGLLGIWHAGGIAAVPPNGQPGTLKEIGAHVRAIVTDRPESVVGADVVPIFGESPAVPARRWLPLDPDTPRLELSTSGTSGARRVCVKTVGHLDREVVGHERRWGSLVGGTQAIATVSPQHIYGLLFRIAWPLVAGRVFRSDALLHLPDVAAAVGDAGTAYLVSTPAHLRRMADSVSLRGLTPACRVIFSSGGPLDSRTAQGLKAALGAAPIEVFGSTETGGVAWRQQDDAGDVAWTPLEDVRIVPAGVDPRLHVESPWVGEPEGAFTMGDRVAIAPDGRFVLGERSDRIVKIGEKRLALPEMEARLHEHPFVAAVALVVLEQRGERRLAGVVVPSAQGTAMLREAGARGLGAILRRWLETHWDRVVLPRAWRFVDQLPEDTQGKTSVAALRAMFPS